MDDKLKLDVLFGNDPELNALLKSMDAKHDGSMAGTPMPSINPIQPTTGGFISPDELFQSPMHTYGSDCGQPQQQPAGRPGLEELKADFNRLIPNEKTPQHTEKPLDFGAFRTPQPAAGFPLETAVPQTKGKKTLRVLFNCLFYLLCVSIIAGAALFAFSNDPGKNYFGYRLYSVKTPSMAPQSDSPPGGFYAGDMIFVKLTEPETLEIGDIITYAPNKNNPASFLTHRIVEIKNKLTTDPNEPAGLYFVTRGDANNTDDPPISADMVIGRKVGSIRNLGGVLEAIRGNFIPILIFVVIAFAFVFTLRYYFSDTDKKKRKEKILPMV